MDKKALKILKEYDVFSPESTSVEDFNYAKEKGVMFDEVTQQHDNCIKNLFKRYNMSAKSHITNSFLSSFDTCTLDYRAGLSVYAIMKGFPYHNFESTDYNHIYCKYCGSIEEDKVDLNFYNQCRYFVGGIIPINVYGYAFYLEQALLLDDIYPSETDFDIFLNILQVINESDENDTPNILKKKIRKVPGFKSNEEQRKALLETLGFCGILESINHKGFLTDYTNLELAPRKRHSSDWKYPVDWWTGKDGLNKEALMFWFRDYPILKEAIESF